MICLVDIETTGLNPMADSILEVGMLIVSDQLEERAYFGRVIAATWEDLLRMPEEVQAMHKESGLMQDVRRPMAMNFLDVYEQACAWLAHELTKGEIPMVGNSIHFDRMFLKVHMPLVEEWFHYRSIDISSIREAAHRWAPSVNEEVLQPAKHHRVADDLHDSLALLKFYKANLFEKVRA